MALTDGSCQKLILFVGSCVDLHVIQLNCSRQAIRFVLMKIIQFALILDELAQSNLVVTSKLQP